MEKIILFCAIFFAFSFAAHAAPVLDSGSGVPVGEQISSEAQSEPTTQKGLVKCGLRQDDPDTLNIDESAPCTFCDFFALLNGAIRWIILIIVPALATLFVAIGGFMLLASRGNPTQTNTGKNILIWTFAGLAIIFVGWMVLNSLLSGIGVMKWTGLAGEGGEFETHFSDGRLYDKDRSGDKAWKENEWNGFTIELNHPTLSGSQTRRITKTSPNTLTVDEPLFPYTQENITLEYKIGGWWQFSCGL